MEQTTSAGPARQDEIERKQRGCAIPLLIGLLLLLFAGVAVFGAGMVERTVLAPFESRIYPNVYALGENLGGFTVDEAAHHLDDLFATYNMGDLILSDGDRSWRIPWSQAGMQLDARATAEQAFRVGRAQGWRTLISMWLAELGWGTSEQVAPAFSIDAHATRDALALLAPALYEPPVDATIRLDGTQVITTASRPGLAMDVDATAEKIVDTVTHLGPDYPFAPTYRPVAPEITDVDAIAAEAEEMLSREIQITAWGVHEGETFSWSWTLARPTLGEWLSIQKMDENPGFIIRRDDAAVGATVERLTAEPEAGEWGFPTDLVTARVLEAFEAGGGEVSVELTPPPRIYVVQSGDHLTTIAARFGMPPGLIAELNRGIDLNQLYVGQELVIPPQDVLTPYETVTDKRIEISIPEQRLRVFENGELLYDWPCSTGKKESPTYTGEFQVLSKEEMAYATQWDLEMPHFIGVYRAGGDTYNGIHALPFLANGQRLWAGHLGSRASFGCIILGVEEAEILFNWVELGVPVTIR